VPGKHPYLSGLFAPVAEELTAVSLTPLSGAVPAELRGLFARVGPNPQHAPEGGYHLFDGDGFIGTVLFDSEGVRQSTSWVETSRFLCEKAAGRASVLKLGDLHGITGLVLIGLEKLKMTLGLQPATSQTANTALEFHAGRLLALNEGDLPHTLRVLCNGALEQLGCLAVGKSRTFTAHPKHDMRSSELLFVGYQLDVFPHLTYGVLDASGALVHSTDIKLRFPVMMHDFAATDKYVLVLDCPLCFEPRAMVEKDSLPFVFRPELGSRIGVLPRRENEDAIRWFEVPGAGFVIFHTLCAWDEPENDLIRLYACRMAAFSLELPAAGEQAFDPSSVDGGSPTLFEFVLNLATGEATSECVCPLPEGCTGMDFPRIHPALVAGARPRARAPPTANRRRVVWRCSLQAAARTPFNIFSSWLRVKWIVILRGPGGLLKSSSQSLRQPWLGKPTH
jgi:carotenoid cleavage dioxygenase